MNAGAETRLGFVGAGRMGLPMVRRLLAAGHRVRVAARSAAAREALAREGAHPVDGVREAGPAAAAVLVCVFSDDQVREVCLGGELVERMPPGSVLVVHTTCGPRTIEDVAARAAPRGVEVVDAPVSGGPHDIEAGRVTLFAGGADDAVARVRPVLRAYADPVLHVGPAGSGQRVKLVNNAVFAAQIGLLSDAARLGTRLGLDEAVLMEALTHGSAASRALSGVAARGSVARFAQATGGFLGKDVEVVRTLAAELGGDLAALDAAFGSLSGAAAVTTRCTR
ncbi:NAD(P)-binding domain-containing protein [Spirillospora sp. NPDC047279]|uniref:NAD(P)-dependent oxidoreductase n=1 Tax=Spirillospora sp. NPDC047279 TaxID=3155478 RepID=UPI0034084A90